MEDIKKMHDDRIVAYYNKFPEEKRLNSRHGQVEYTVTASYIDKFLQKLREKNKDGSISVIDIGAGTGRYAVPLAEAGYDVTAVEFVKYNVGILKQKNSGVKAYVGDARKLKRFADNSFDIAVFLGPMYHLIDIEDKVQALKEAVRVTKSGGYIFAGYLMNEYSILTYGFKQHHILEMMENQNKNGADSKRTSDDQIEQKGDQSGLQKEAIGSFHDHASYGSVTEDFRVIPDAAGDLYDYVRLEDLDEYNQKAGDVTSVCRFSPDGAANYMRQELNALSEEEFQAFIQYQLCICERPELLGAGGHIVDVLQVN